MFGVVESYAPTEDIGFMEQGFIFREKPYDEEV
jgi:hypothetical protein